MVTSPVIVDWDRLSSREMAAMSHAHDLTGKCRKHREGPKCERLSIVNQGRYDGDMFPILEHNPTAKRPYRIRVAHWHVPAEGAAFWRDAHMVFPERREDRSFRSLAAALRYRRDVLAVADSKHFRQLQARNIESEWVSL